jgi:hypothetical protein
MSDSANITWRKSSYSGGSGDCVEVGWTAPAEVAVRDSKQAAGPTLGFPSRTWRAFLARMA